MNFTGMKCPICEKPFSAGDDIVVCPQCGAPYHRECYKKVGQCIYTDRHGTPDAWHPPEHEESPQEETKRCPRCGAVNAKDALFCAHCGHSFSEVNTPPRDTSFPYQNQDRENQEQRYGWGIPPQNGYPPQNGNNIPPDYGFPFLFDPLGGVSPNEPIEGIPAGDIAKFVQGNTPYYLPVFMAISRFGRNRFNFSAFLLQGIWMLYRKMYWIGSIFTALQAVLFSAYIIVSRDYTAPLYQKLFALAGVTTNDYYSMTTAQQNALMNLIAQLSPLQKLVVISPMLFFLGQIAIMLISGILANRLYLKNCVTQIKKIQAETENPSDYSIRLQQEGGMNTVLATTLVLCFFLLIYIL
ncbi:MAG: Zinc-ribbon-2 domain-containing protein [Thermocaproicibacter melissae]|jgi:uncharacterized Zn finger protein (UPF0148 family)|uniref:RING finger protein n=1 Tax=Thermocaproicibacter melissae TaxID=2966552 RepID=UPI0024B0E619|nr:RING finger protein [Thermocaproicibacter melissae]WBY63307.1 RING finger protein [Thermocaproicibacter melissae]